VKLWKEREEAPSLWGGWLRKKRKSLKRGEAFTFLKRDLPLPEERGPGENGNREWGM